MKKCIVLGYVLVFLATSQVWSQTIYQPTIRVPVTYYDFHSDGSNPEFEKAPTGAATRLGMVANTLDAQRKPVLGAAPYWDCQIAKWFRAWTPGDYTIPNYTTPATTLCSNPVSTVNYDTAFKNMVFQDTLTFNYQAGTAGTYQFQSSAFFPLDGRGFGAEVSQGTMRTHNYSFTMELHWEFIKVPGLTFQFEGDDDVWAFINNRLVMDIGGIHNTTVGSVNVDDLGLTNNTKYMFDFFYAERHVTGSDIRITTNIISANPIGINLARVPDTKIINTGDSIAYVASVIDDTLGVRKDLSRLVTWSVTPLVPGSIRPNFSPAARLLRSTAGDSNTFYGGQAYRYYVITSVLVDPTNPSNILRKYDTVYVKPQADYRVVIEADTIIDTFAPARLGLITMNGSTNSARAYALVRDIYGQFTRMATNAEWTSRDPALATVAAGPPKYVGIISRIPLQNGTDTIVANETAPALLLPDSVQLVLQSGTVDSIRLVNSVTGGVITSISMNTDSSVSVKIQVVWSNDVNHAWVDGTGTWALSPNTIQWDANPPTEGGTWNISPKTPGTENLTVASGTVSKTVPLIITPANPSRVTLQLANPADSIIAGRPFKIVAKIYNTDGLVPGPWCSTSATYTDALDNGTKSVQPTIIINGITYNLGPLGQTSSECFNNGLDTITVTLYNAPLSLDSTHTISLVLNNKIINLPIASTDPFHLYPGPLASLALEYSSGKPMPGPDTLRYPDGAVNIYARGYDQWGNLIGPIRSTWAKSGTLHDLTPPTSNQFHIYYDASNAILDENGVITASAPSGINPGTDVSASVQVIIVPRGANLAQALTKDMNGNGLLDQIWLTFDKPIPVSYSANITVQDVAHNVTFIVDSLRPFNSTGDSTSTYIIYLRDLVDASNGILEPQDRIPETAWRPLITISGLNGANDVNNQKCNDGAGPVIWRVVCTKNNATDRSKDLVTVTFSEPIEASNGNNFSISTLPSLVFNTWKHDGNSLVPDTSLLACNAGFPGNPCINAFYKIVDASTVQFYMLNQMTLFDYDYFSIRMLPSSQVADQASTAGANNLPVANNQRVKVVITGVVSPLQVGPNPAAPTVFNVPTAASPSEIVFKNDPNATRYAKQYGGTVFRINIVPGDSGQGRVTGYLNIYDVVGNVVNSVHKDGPNDDLMTEITKSIGTGSAKDTLGFYNYDIYWNGLNSKGMKVAPGVYHAFMYLTTYNRFGTISNKSRQQAIVGISR